MDELPKLETYHARFFVWSSELFDELISVSYREWGLNGALSILNLTGVEREREGCHQFL